VCQVKSGLSCVPGQVRFVICAKLFKIMTVYKNYDLETTYIT